MNRFITLLKRAHQTWVNQEERRFGGPGGIWTRDFRLFRLGHAKAAYALTTTQLSFMPNWTTGPLGFETKLHIKRFSLSINETHSSNCPLRQVTFSDTRALCIGLLRYRCALVGGWEWDDGLLGFDYALTVTVRESGKMESYMWGKSGFNVIRVVHVVIVFLTRR